MIMIYQLVLRMVVDDDDNNEGHSIVFNIKQNNTSFRIIEFALLTRLKFKEF